MTFADDFASDEQLIEPDYPSVFGITFTPMVLGIVIGVAGISLAAYGFIKFVQPTQAEYQKTITQKQELETQLNSIKTGDLQLKLAEAQADLAEKKVLKSRVLSMFTSEDDLETLLIDLNSFIATNQGDLTQYQPDSNVSTISDASFGTAVQGKLKRKGISLTFEGTFNETKQILQDLERLQPLLMVQSISSGVMEEPTAILTSNQIVQQKQSELRTQIKLDAILPLSQAELERAKKADQQAEQAAQNKERRRREK